MIVVAKGSGGGGGGGQGIIQREPVLRWKLKYFNLMDLIIILRFLLHFPFIVQLHYHSLVHTAQHPVVNHDERRLVFFLLVQVYSSTWPWYNDDDDSVLLWAFGSDAMHILAPSSLHDHHLYAVVG